MHLDAIVICVVFDVTSMGRVTTNHMWMWHQKNTWNIVEQEQANSKLYGESTSPSGKPQLLQRAIGFPKLAAGSPFTETISSPSNTPATWHRAQHQEYSSGKTRRCGNRKPKKWHVSLSLSHSLFEIRWIPLKLCLNMLIGVHVTQTTCHVKL